MSDTVKECLKCGFHYWESVGCPNGCAAKLAEPALHIPQQGQHKICPQCGGDLVEMYQADVYICNDCGIKVTGKLRA